MTTEIRLLLQSNKRQLCADRVMIHTSIVFVGAELTTHDAGLTPKPHSIDTPQVTTGNRSGQDVGHQFRELTSPSWATFDVTGDEAKEGPIYNYARVFTWWKFSNTLENTFEALITNLRGQKNCRNQDWIINSSLENNLTGTASDISRFCDLDNANLDAYPEWEEVGSEVWHQLAIAAVVAIWVQWGTTGKQNPGSTYRR